MSEVGATLLGMKTEITLDFEVPQTLEEKKEQLLAQLESKQGKYKYKRMVTSTLRYAGGKSLAIGHILELLPPNTQKIMSPFFGGGSVEFALSKHLGLEVVGYDIFDILTNFWSHQIHQPEQLADKLAAFEPSKEEYLRVRAILKAHWKGEQIIEDKLDLAAIYYFNHNTSYGPHFLGHPSGVYLNSKRYATTLQKVRDFEPGNIEVFEGRFEDTIPAHSGSLIYADPPYYLEGDSKTFIGMYPHRNFPIHHKGFDHEKLASLLRNHKGGFILSYNDCTTVRELYKGFNMSTPEWQYTFSQGDTRIGENRLRDSEGSHVKKSHEILIWGGF
jgi:DNA adenine methylase